MSDDFFFDDDEGTNDALITQQALVDTQEKLGALLDLMPTGLVIHQKHSMLYANQQALELLELAAEQITGCHLLDFLDHDDHGEYSTLFMFTFEHDEPVRLPELALKTASGEPRYVQITAGRLPWEGTSVIQILLEDVTEVKSRAEDHLHMQQELERASKWEAVGHLAGGIAHEINTPCQYISSNLKFLNDNMTGVFGLLAKTLEVKKQLQGHPEFTSTVQTLDQMIEDLDLDFLLEEVPLAFEQSIYGVQQISQIVTAMRDFSHPGAKEKNQVDINQALKTTLIVSRNEWKNVATVEENYDETLGKLDCYADGVNQVFLNIIVNAAQAVEDSQKDGEGIIGLSTQDMGDHVEVRISDNGSGIPEEAQDHIFAPFFTTKEVGRGTGQGLSICHDIVVKKHNGSLTFETQEGQGTTFIIQLPKA
ncbi:ATP-binding protein [Terasakiella sp. SH-1]|uniref:PAS domain-containing sensor histidine kinase n=1 Tax=Terasakiella sp. SH-1 TaxID=2560057 RepID=UPI001430F877|nr:ATP-binding protein [Terasakiella sp. SH-1]